MVMPPSRNVGSGPRDWRVCCVADSRAQTGVGGRVCAAAHRLRGGANHRASYDPDIDHRPVRLRNLVGVVHGSGRATGGRCTGCGRIPSCGQSGRAHCGSPAHSGYDLQRADGAVTAPGATHLPSRRCLDPNTGAGANPSAGAQRARTRWTAQPARCANSARNWDPRRRSKPGPDDGCGPSRAGRRPDSRRPATAADSGTTDRTTAALDTPPSWRWCASVSF